MENSSKKTRWADRLRLIAKVFGGVAIVGFGLSHSGCVESGAESFAAPRVRLVETFTVEHYADKRISNYLGRVRAPKEVNLAFELPGKVEWIANTTGQYFKKGEKLGELDSKRYELALAAAEQRLSFANKELARMEQLLVGGSSTVAAYDRVQNAALLAQIVCEQAKQDRDDCTLYAPFDGKLAARKSEVGSFVAPGQAVVVFQETGRTEVDFFQTERQLSHLLRGLRDDSIELRLSDEALEDFELGLKDYSTLPDGLSGSYRTTLVLSESCEDLLLPGSPVRFELIESLAVLGESSVDIPADALVTLPGGRFQVWIFEEGASRPQARTVELGRVGAKNVEVLQGLRLGDRVVTSGSSLLREDSCISNATGV